MIESQPKVGETQVKAAVERLNTKIKALDEHLADKVCRICFCAEDEVEDEPKNKAAKKDKKRIENPLVTPCSCTGSSRFIHLKCLHKWLDRSRACYQYDECSTTIYKISSCELCNSKYPDKVKIKGEVYDIFTVQRPKDLPYLLLEVLGMPEGKNLKVISIPRERVVVLGRSDSSDLMIND